MKKLESNTDPEKVFDTGIWVILHDENGVPYDIINVVLLAICGVYVICSPHIASCVTLSDVLEYYRTETEQAMHSELSVYPLEDCYLDIAGIDRRFLNATKVEGKRLQICTPHINRK